MPGAGEQDQPLAGNAARLSSKVAKAEARRGLAPAPDSALNFRPAVSCSYRSLLLWEFLRWSIAFLNAHAQQRSY